MFNPSPTVSLRLLDPTHDPDAIAVVVDDFLSEPRALVAFAQRHLGAFAAPTQNAFPGPELPLPASVTMAMIEQFGLRARRQLGARRVRHATSRLSIVTVPPSQLGPLQRLCHRDRLGTANDELPAACVVYLFDDPALGGTAFYRPRRPVVELEAFLLQAASLDREGMTRELGCPPGYLVRDNAWFERTAVIEPAFNRAIFYAGDRFHTSHIERPDRLDDSPIRGRLTLNAFFVCRRLAR